MKRSILLVSLAITAFGGAAVAQGVDASVAQKKGWEEYAKNIGEKAGEVNKACGGKLQASFDKSTYREFDPIKDRTFAACRDVANNLVALCATPTGKQAVAALSQMSCRFSTSGTTASRQGSKLLVDIDPANSSIKTKSPGGSSWKTALEETL